MTARGDVPMDRPSMQKFSAANPDGCREYYDAHGYVVFEKLIDDDVCDKFIDVYNRLKGDRLFIFPTQSTYESLPFIPDENGHIAESVENPAFMVLRPKFAAATRQCLLNEGMARGLAALDGHARHVLWQSMFFDKSTGTPVHQDSLYLDTEPRGQLVGAWVALEDIDPRSGPFVVYPGSHRSRPFTDDDAIRHGNIQNYCRDILQSAAIAPVEMIIDKGDVIFWHPFLIHGSADNRDLRFSRKSLTAHFYPSDCLTIYDRDHKTPTHQVTPAFELHQRNLHLYHLGAYVRWAKRKLAGRAARSSRDKAKVLV